MAIAMREHAPRVATAKAGRAAGERMAGVSAFDAVGASRLGRSAPFTDAFLSLQRDAGNQAVTMWVQRFGASHPMLRRGNQGPSVAELQEKLNHAIASGLDPDGIFGSKTDGSVRNFQSTRHLDVDGIVGDQTWGALDQAGSPASGGLTLPGGAPPANKDTDPADDFRIRGLPTDRAEHPNTIFFDFAKADVPVEEESKLDLLARDPADVVLEGSSSEEGQGNFQLTESRLNAVVQGLVARQHQGKRTRRNSTATAVGKIDYRANRQVKVTHADAPDPLANCNRDGSIIDCPADLAPTSRAAGNCCRAPSTSSPTLPRCPLLRRRSCATFTKTTATRPSAR
jgi:hypothetical protein